MQSFPMNYNEDLFYIPEDDQIKFKDIKHPDSKQDYTKIESSWTNSKNDLKMRDKSNLLGIDFNYF
jgi:hypothetical protein